MASAGPYASLHLTPDRQLVTPAPQHSVLYRPDALPAANQQCQSTEANDNILYTNMTKDKQNKYRVPTNPTNKNSSRLKGTFTPVDFFNVATINITKF